MTVAMTEDEMMRYRWLRREIALDRERLARCRREKCARKIEAAIERKIRRAETEAVRIEEYVATIDEPVVRMLVVERYINGRTWRDAGRKCGWITEDAARKRVRRYLDRYEQKNEKGDGG